MVNDVANHELIRWSEEGDSFIGELELISAVR